MMTMITSEFEAPELAEHAAARIKKEVEGVYNVCSQYISSQKTVIHHPGAVHAFASTICTLHCHGFTSMTDSCDDDFPETCSMYRSAKTIIFCDESSVSSVCSMLHALGGYNISTK